MTLTTAETDLGHYIEANGLRFYYRDLGDAEATPVVFLHGIMGHSYEWDVLLDDLVADHRVIALEQRGHGRSEWADSYRPQVMVDDVLAVTEALGLSRTHLVAHSMGAIVSALLAAQRPERVDRLVLIDIAPASLDWSASPGPEMLAAGLRAMSSASYSSVQEALDEWLAGDQFAREPLLRRYVEYALTRRDDGTWVWRFDAASIGQFLRTVGPETLWDALDRIEAPTLLVRGQRSEFVSPEAALAVTQRLRHSSYAEVPNGAHDLGVQQPKAVAAAVRTFLGSTG